MVRMKRSILLCQVGEGCGGVGPGDEAAVDGVGEVALEGSSGFSGGFSFGDLAREVGLGGGVVALLDDGDAVERGVELAVASAVQAGGARGFFLSPGGWGRG